MTMTPDRRTFLELTLATVLPPGFGGQAPAPRGAAELARHALTGALQGFDVVLLELTNPPGPAGSGPGHRHPGPVLGYVTEGRMRFAIDDQPVRVLEAGHTFFEPTGALHSAGGSASANAPAKALVFMVVPTGSPVVSPA